MLQSTYQQHSLRIERRHYTCPICGNSRVIETRPIEKHVVVCSHGDSRGGVLPVVLLREEGALLH